MSGSPHDGEPLSASVVAYYGPVKPPAFAEAVAGLQSAVAAGLGTSFLPRPLVTTHSTVVGLDVLGPVHRSGDLVGRLRDDPRADLAGFAEHLRAVLDGSAVTLQLGGFPDRDLGLTSRGQRPYVRSVTADRGQVVLVGWPVDDAGRPLATLDRLRREARRFGIEHRYPLTASEQDPDAHVVVGELAAGVPTDELLAALGAARGALATRTCRMPLRAEDLAVVAYADPRLPWETTVRVSLGDVAA